MALKKHSDPIILFLISSLLPNFSPFLSKMANISQGLHRLALPTEEAHDA